MKTSSTILKVIGRKLGVLALLSVSAVAFATLGDGTIKSKKTSTSLLSNKSQANLNSFSLRSGYTFRGNQVLTNKPTSYTNLNTIISFQKGHTTYVLPSKKTSVLNNKLVFNPNEASRR